MPKTPEERESEFWKRVEAKVLTLHLLAQAQKRPAQYQAKSHHEALGEARLLVGQLDALLNTQEHD